MNAPQAIQAAIALATLPALGAEYDGGLFAGLITRKDGTHVAVILLPAKTEECLTWDAATAWAAEAGGELPTRPIAALLYANAKGQFTPDWYWTADTLDVDTGEQRHASCAWYCSFYDGDQTSNRKSYEGLARAVRCIPVTA